MQCVLDEAMYVARVALKQERVVRRGLFEFAATANWSKVRSSYDGINDGAATSRPPPPLPNNHRKHERRSPPPFSLLRLLLGLLVPPFQPHSPFYPPRGLATTAQHAGLSPSIAIHFRSTFLLDVFAALDTLLLFLLFLFIFTLTLAFAFCFLLFAFCLHPYSYLLTVTSNVTSSRR